MSEQDQSAWENNLRDKYGIAQPEADDDRMDELRLDIERGLDF